MSGHSKWSTIKRKKGEIDAARGKVFQKLAKEIYVAAKSGTPDPDSNPSLRMVVEKARGQNMPKDNIQKAIDKAKGTNNTESYDAIRYEGYGAGGVAFIVDCLTDNKNRTASQVRAAFTKHGGNLGTAGSVSYMFSRRGIIVVDKKIEEDMVMMTSLDAGAEDFITEEDSYIIYTTPENFIKVKEEIEKLGYNEFITSEVTLVANNEMEVNDEIKTKIYALQEVLEDIDDVQEVYHNMNE